MIIMMSPLRYIQRPEYGLRISYIQNFVDWDNEDNDDNHDDHDHDDYDHHHDDIWP